MRNDPVCHSEDTRIEQEHPLPGYVRPEIITYSSEQLLEEIGPANACSPNPCGVG